MDPSDLRHSHLVCRSLGHAWKPLTVTVVRGARGQVVEYLADLVCVRCDTGRTRRLTPLGEAAGNRYRYAEGYRPPKGEVLDRQEVRVEWIRQALERGED